MFGEDRDIEFGRLIEKLKKNIILIILLFVIGAAAGYAYTKIFVKYTFSSTAQIIVIQRKNTTSQSSTQTTTTDNTNSVYEIGTSRTLVSTYKQIFYSNPIAGKVVSNLNLDKKHGINAASLKGIVSISSAESTEIMNITATTGDPLLSADIANEMVYVFQKEVPSILSLENVTVLNEAVPASSPNSTNMLTHMGIGALGGIFLGLLIVFIKVISDRKVKTVSEVRNIFDYPVIGEIPDFDPYISEKELKNEQN